ncbi:MAG: hypothetical protein MI924_12105 [Chloroflexales bacterium]|nr:hypothetical protein [Chloroflexales bacterium]
MIEPCPFADRSDNPRRHPNQRGQDDSRDCQAGPIGQAVGDLRSNRTFRARRDAQIALGQARDKAGVLYRQRLVQALLDANLHDFFFTGQ